MTESISVTHFSYPFTCMYIYIKWCIMIKKHLMIASPYWLCIGCISMIKLCTNTANKLDKHQLQLWKKGIWINLFLRSQTRSIIGLHHFCNISGVTLGKHRRGSHDEEGFNFIHSRLTFITGLAMCVHVHTLILVLYL